MKNRILRRGDRLVGIVDREYLDEGEVTVVEGWSGVYMEGSASGRFVEDYKFE